MRRVRVNTNVSSLGLDCFFIADTEADARAKMLIYLHENDFIN
jgi:hypothetical protein